jgi:signal transduction histidine kinase
MAGDENNKKEAAVHIEGQSKRTELSRLQLEILKKAKEKARISEPISVIAHQLKNPLAVLRGYTEVLMTETFGHLNGKQKEYLADSLTNIKKMLKMVTELLDITRIDEGRYQIQKKSIDLSRVCEEVIANFTVWARASNCEFIFEKPAEPMVVLTDPLKIYDVVENFLSNAVKYKPAGRGIITIVLEKKGSDVLFTCRDNGVGISQKDHTKVFSKFYRSERALEIDPSGTGIGLYIIKSIIELSGGKVWFESETDKGTAFHFTLPLSK